MPRQTSATISTPNFETFRQLHTTYFAPNPPSLQSWQSQPIAYKTSSKYFSRPFPFLPLLFPSLPSSLTVTPTLSLLLLIPSPQTQSRLFSHLYNPLRLRTGNSVLRQRLKGPALAAYYPRRITTLQDIMRMYPELETYDEDEADREDNIVLMKARGKGAPKKKRTREESKKFAKRGGRPATPAKAPPS